MWLGLRFGFGLGLLPHDLLHVLVLTTYCLLLTTYYLLLTTYYPPAARPHPAAASTPPYAARPRARPRAPPTCETRRHRLWPAARRPRRVVRGLGRAFLYLSIYLSGWRSEAALGARACLSLPQASAGLGQSAAWWVRWPAIQALVSTCASDNSTPLPSPSAVEMRTLS